MPEQVEQALEQPPELYGLPRATWRLQDVGAVFPRLASYTLAGISKLLRRLGLSRQRGRLAVHSPDPAYRQKFLQLEQALCAAVDHPDHVRVLFGDEVRSYRHPSLGQRWALRGQEPVARLVAGRPDCWRIAGALDAVSGQVTGLARNDMRLPSLRAYLRLLRERYPDRSQRLVLVWDH